MLPLLLSAVQQLYPFHLKNHSQPDSPAEGALGSKRQGESSDDKKYKIMLQY